LDQALVRPGHDLEDFHPVRGRGEAHPHILHGPLQYSQALRWRTRLAMG
jgi:hypothetical protein